MTKLQYQKNKIRSKKERKILNSEKISKIRNETLERRLEIIILLHNTTRHSIPFSTRRAVKLPPMRAGRSNCRLREQGGQIAAYAGRVVKLPPTRGGWSNCHLREQGGQIAAYTSRAVQFLYCCDPNKHIGGCLNTRQQLFCRLCRFCPHLWNRSRVYWSISEV